MVDTLTPRFLDRRTIDKAYPLARNMVPGMTAARWTQFVRPHLARRSPDWPRGVMTIQNAAGYILSLFAFEVRADLHETRIFHMDHIMIPNLLSRTSFGMRFHTRSGRGDRSFKASGPPRLCRSYQR